MKNLSESLEKYLLAVYEISKNNPEVKVKDVADYMKIGGASTSEAIKTLAEKNFLNYIPYGSISLTPLGVDTVELKLYRHNTISKFLNKVLEIEKERADKNATSIEYSMTEDVLIKFVHFLDFMEQCSCKEPKWLKSCKHNLENGQMSEKCLTCTSGCQGGCGCCSENH